MNKVKRIEISGGEEVVTFDYKHFLNRRRDIFEAALRHAKIGPNPKYYLIEIEIESGWVTAFNMNEEYYKKEIFRVELDERAVLNNFGL